MHRNMSTARSKRTAVISHVSECQSSLPSSRSQEKLFTFLAFIVPPRKAKAITVNIPRPTLPLALNENGACFQRDARIRRWRAPE